MKRLKTIENDKRIYQIETVYDDGEKFYLMWLEDGYIFDDGSHVNRADNVAELNDLLSAIEIDESYQEL